MLIEMPELGTIDNKCVASLAGLAPDRPRLRPAQRQALHPRRTRSPPPSALHASLGRDPLQRGHENQISGPHRRRKATKSRHHGGHAKARHPRQCAPPRTPELDAKCRLSKTDTLVSVSIGPRSRFVQAFLRPPHRFDHRLTRPHDFRVRVREQSVGHRQSRCQYPAQVRVAARPSPPPTPRAVSA